MWLAVDEATIENGALRVITGSHSHTREHLPVPTNSDYWSTFTSRGNTMGIDRIVDCSMPAGLYAV
jgi:ectoine hydroxylase-related dioxygenase (phytanoyl-CoA dioxygenase family)